MTPFTSDFFSGMCSSGMANIAGNINASNTNSYNSTERIDVIDFGYISLFTNPIRLNTNNSIGSTSYSCGCLNWC